MLLIYEFCSFYSALSGFVEMSLINLQQVSEINCKEHRREFCVLYCKGKSIPVTGREGP
jgi:hypothetical protein